MNQHYWVVALVFITLLAPGAAGMALDGAQIGHATGATATSQENVTEIDSCQVIEEPGTYVLTEDLEPTELVTGNGTDHPSVGPHTGCLVLEESLTSATGIHIEGNGHTISGDSVTDRTAAGYAAGAAISNSEVHATVTNVTVTGWQTGIRSYGFMGVSNVVATGNDRGSHLSWGGDVTNSTFTENRVGLAIGLRDSGAGPTGGAGEITNNRFTNNTETGAAITSWGGIISENVIADNGDTGIIVVGDAEFSDNAVTRNGNHGLSTSPLVEAGGALEITGNEFTDNEGAGIYHDGYALAPPSSEIHRNHIEGNGAGIWVAVIPDSETIDGDVIESPYIGWVNATNNYWGEPSGPASETGSNAPLADPVTGTLADGQGDTVSEGNTTGISNVHFDPWLTTTPTTGVDQPADSDDSNQTTTTTTTTTTASEETTTTSEETTTTTSTTTTVSDETTTTTTCEETLTTTAVSDETTTTTATTTEGTTATSKEETMTTTTTVANDTTTTSGDRTMPTTGTTTSEAPGFGHLTVILALIGSALLATRHT